MSDEYLPPEQATRIRIFPDGLGNWQIDADDGGEGHHIEACWDGYSMGADWRPYETVEIAMQFVDQFARKNVPHLVGTKPHIFPQPCPPKP